MYNPATQVQVPTDANLGSYFQKTKIAIGAFPTTFPFKKIKEGGGGETMDWAAADHRVERGVG
jgi:hypothetical protein